MKKLNVALIIFILFSILTFIGISIYTENSPILLSVTEYKIGEYKVSGIDEIQIEYEEEQKYETNTYYQIADNKVLSVTYDSNATPGLDGRLGNIGRLIIPQINISVALNESVLETTEDAQRIVNAYDSACYVSYPGWTTYIGDHFFDGFINIKNAIPGVTKAYIYWNDGTISTYKCMSKYFNGVNKGRIYDDNGTDMYLSGYDIAMVTCNGYNSSTVTVTYWNKE